MSTSGQRRQTSGQDTAFPPYAHCAQAAGGPSQFSKVPTAADIGAVSIITIKSTFIINTSGGRGQVKTSVVKSLPSKIRQFILNVGVKVIFQ